jgi:hypothetical protein
MLDYQEGKIYKLVSCVNESLVYYGSTCQLLKNRLKGHVSRYKMQKGGHKHSSTSFDLFELGEVKIHLVEDYPCNNKKELHKREGYYQKNNVCVNKIKAGRTKKEWRNENKDKVKDNHKKWRDNNKEKLRKKSEEYRNNNIEVCRERSLKSYHKHKEKNKESIAKSGKKYRENNKGVIAERQKEWRGKNKEKTKEAWKEYYEKNKEKLNAKRNEKHECDCGGRYTNRGRSAHFKTKKHVNYVNNNIS